MRALSQKEKKQWKDGENISKKLLCNDINENDNSTPTEQKNNTAYAGTIEEENYIKEKEVTETIKQLRRGKSAG